MFKFPNFLSVLFKTPLYVTILGITENISTTCIAYIDQLIQQKSIGLSIPV